MIIIIGGGIFGLTVGWRLVQAGHPVTILEKDAAGQGATWAAAGMLMPWKLSDKFSEDLFALQQASYKLWPEHAAELQAVTGLPVHYETGGRYFVATSERAAQRLRRQYEYHRELDFPLTWLPGKEARRREPAFGPKIQVGVFAPMGHWVDNRALVAALCLAFVEAGGALRERTPVEGVVSEGGRVRGVRAGDEVIPAERVIVAAGTGLNNMAGLPEPLPGLIQPRKGQTVIVQTDAPLVTCPVLGPVYLVPRADGRLVLGTTVERGVNDSLATAGGVMRIISKACDIVPAVFDLPLDELCAGVRPTGPDRLPVLGRTAMEGLLVAGGGHSYGILLSPVVAQSVTHLVSTGEVPALIRPFEPGAGSR